MKYKSTDGAERTLEADFTRYSAVFTGEKLPDGKKADAVYIILNEPYWEVLNNAPVRPLDYDYLKALSPGPQRFYEIISYRVYATLKNRQPYAKLLYSEYCTFSAQQRYFDYDHFKKQMYKVHRPHLQSGYLAKVEYEKASAGGNGTDWMMIYTPGPKAKAEFAAFTKQPQAIDIKTKETPHAPVGVGSARTKKELLPLSAEQQVLLAELTRRGITDSGARKVLATLAEHQPVLDQLEYIDHQVKTSDIKNPPGFYLTLLKENITVPDDFMTSRKRKLREEAFAERDRAIHEQLKRDQAYDDYRRQEISRYIETHPDEYAQVFAAKRLRFLEKYPRAAEWESSVLERTVTAAAHTEIGEGYVSLHNYETFFALQHAESQPPPTE